MGKNIDWSLIAFWGYIVAVCAIFVAIGYTMSPNEGKRSRKDRTYDAIIYYQTQIGALDNIMKHYIKHPAIDSSGLYYGLDSISYYYGEQQAYQDAIRFLIDTTK